MANRCRQALLLGAVERRTVMKFQVDGCGGGHPARGAEDMQRQLARRRLTRQQRLVQDGGYFITPGHTAQMITGGGKGGGVA